MFSWSYLYYRCTIFLTSVKLEKRIFPSSLFGCKICLKWWWLILTTWESLLVLTVNGCGIFNITAISPAICGDSSFAKIWKSIRANIIRKKGKKKPGLLDFPVFFLSRLEKIQCMSNADATTLPFSISLHSIIITKIVLIL